MVLHASLAHTTSHLRAPPPLAIASKALPFLGEAPPKLDGTMAGDVGFDPLNLSESAVPLPWMREAEIKHGRVCMLAIVGYIAVDAGIRAPGADKIGTVTSFTAHDATVASGHMFLLLGVAGVLELAGIAGIAASLKGERTPGNFELGSSMVKDVKQLDRMQLAEITHCRLAMMAFSGLVTQAALGHTAFPHF